MRSLLRSLFVADKSDDKQVILRNYQAFMGSGLGFDVPEYDTMWNFIRDFVRRHNHVPDVATLRSHFRRSREDQVVDQLERLVGLPAKVKGDFLTELEARASDRRSRDWNEALKNASIIAATGMEMQSPDSKDKKFLQGPIASARYIMEQTHDIVAPTIGGRLSGEVTKDGEAAKEEYERIEADPLAGIGQFSFLKQMDDALGGAQRQELWIHAAFTGGMKSTFMLNWAYNQAIIYGHSSLIFSLEMPYQQCRRILYAMHSAHPKFREIRLKFGLQSDQNEDVGLPYQNIKHGNLHEWHPNAKKFYFDFVIPDFNGVDVVKHPYFKCDYGKIHIEVADPDKDDFTIHDLRSMAEIIYAEDPYSLLFVDHCGLMSPRKFRKSTTENLNEVIRDLKKLALGFNRGQGIAVVGLFQISREGYKSALKAKEKTGKAGYNLTHLSYANECCKHTELLRFSDGMRPISTAVVGDEVWSSSGWRTVRHVFDQGVRPLWAVTTDRGSKLECTGNHQVRVVRDGSLGWQRVDALKPGEYVVGSLAGGGPQKPALLPSPWAGAHTLTEDIAYVLGAWHGDGRVRPNGVGFTGNRNEADLESRLQSSLERVHGSKSPVVLHMESRTGSFDMELYDTSFKEWFEGVAGNRAEDVPPVVLGSPDNLRCAFLRGLFDTDGWMNKAGVVGIKMKAACEPFLRQVQLMMQGLGIDTHLSFGSGKLKATGKTYGSVTLRVRSRRGREEFARLVGFTEPHKQKMLLSFVEAGRESAKRGDVQMYPVPGTFLRAYEQVRPAGSSWQGYTPGFLDAPRKASSLGLVSKGNIEKLIAHARDKNVWDADFEFLRLLVEDLLVMQVVSAQPTGDEARVWDLEVGGDYEYQTGPLLSHNCERSADIVTTTWIDEDLKNQSRVQFNNLKSRDQAPFDPFVARVEWPCRRLYSCFEVTLSPEEAAKRGDEIDKAGKALDD